MKHWFHKVSYLQYPLMLVGLYYAYKPLVFGFDSAWADYNVMLVFMGLGISMSTLQDTQKTQNKISLRIWQNPKYTRWALIYLLILIGCVLLFGMYCLFITGNSHLKELSFGVIALGIGLIGLLKSAMEMAENFSRKKSDEKSTNMESS
jgi:hypothetical protein